MRGDTRYTLAAFGLAACAGVVFHVTIAQQLYPQRALDSEMTTRTAESPVQRVATVPKPVTDHVFCEGHRQWTRGLVEGLPPLKSSGDCAFYVPNKKIVRLYACDAFTRELVCTCAVWNSGIACPT